MNQSNSGFISSIPLVTRNIIIINLLVWLAQFLLGADLFGIGNRLPLYYMGSEHFVPYQFITYMFLHDPFGFGHVFFNMFAVFMFGRTLETVWGPKKFLFYYLSTGIGAALAQQLVCYLTGDINSVMVGASGAVFGILVAFGMMFPNAELFVIPIPFPIKAKWFVIIYGLIELGLGVANNPADSVAHFAHLGGLVTGFFIMLYWRKKAKSNGNFHG